VGNLARHLHGTSVPGGFSSANVTPALLSHRPAVIREGFVVGCAESIQTVFLVAVPIAELAFLCSLLVPQVELRRWSAPPSNANPAAESVPSATAAQ
jgi:hypothetical protein